MNEVNSGVAVKLVVLYGTKRQVTEHHCWVFFLLEKEPSNTFPCLFPGVLLCRWTFGYQSHSFPALSHIIIFSRMCRRLKRSFTMHAIKKIATFDATSHVPFLQKSFKVISNLVASNKFLQAFSNVALEEKFYYLGVVDCPSSKQILVSTSVFLVWVDAKHQTFFKTTEIAAAKLQIAAYPQKSFTQNR